MSASPARRVLAGVLAAATLVTALLTGTATPAQAETLPLPLTGATAFVGHGFGHGHGMSQWGAYGAATKGRTWAQITSFYYPGTHTGNYGNPTLRVRLSALGATGVTVIAAGVKLEVGTRLLTLPATHHGKPIDRWRLVRATTGRQSLQWRAGGTWTTHATYRNTTAPLGFATSTGVIRVQLPASTRYRDYPGRVRSVPNGSSLTTLNVTTLDSYLRGVVPNEMPASWPTEAVRAQAVVARTYAAHERTTGAWDLCDTTACQVYKGWADRTATGALLTANTHPRSDAAITATTGRIVSYAGKPAFTQFSASNGGWTVAGTRPYLVAKADPYDGAAPASYNPHTWTASTSTARTALQRAYPRIGAPLSLALARGGHGQWGGRVTTATVIGTRGRVTVTGDTLRSVLGLRSPWFTVTNADHLRKDTSGDGRPDAYGRTAGGVLYRVPTTGTALKAPTRLGSGWNAMRTIVPAGDLTGDGTGDLLARDSTGRLWCYTVPRTGSTMTRKPVSVPASVDRVAGVGDVTTDGRGDFVGIDRATGKLWLYRGNGACGYTSRTATGSGWNAMTMIVGADDTNRDGRPDLWAREANGTLWAYRLNAAGAFTGRTRVGTGWNGMTDLVALGDRDGGGADLLARDRTGRLWQYPGTGTGTFKTRVPVTGSAAPFTLLR